MITFFFDQSFIRDGSNHEEEEPTPLKYSVNFISLSTVILTNSASSSSASPPYLHNPFYYIS